VAKILVVDDQTCIQHFYQEELTACGYDVTVASDGDEAIAKIEVFKPDVVVLDLFLGGPNGWEVLDIIKNRDVYLPVIIITAYDSYREDPRLKKADGYVIKSFNLTELKQRISELFKNQQEEKPLLDADDNTLLREKLVPV
jgi:DNA-binding response OmpR family regulator